MQLLTVSQVANELKISSPTVYRLIRERQLKARKFRGSYRIERGELDRYVKSATP
jgi:excisionase family DNA binding protein